MSLTLGSGPLASNTPGQFNFSLDQAPKHRILFEDLPAPNAGVGGRPHACWTPPAGCCCTSPTSTPSTTRRSTTSTGTSLAASDHHTHCPFKGDASYWSLKVGDRELENAVWHYPEPLAESPWLEGYAALYWGKPDLWLYEDEPVRGHLRDPYHRVDVMESSRRVTVKVKGTTVADSDRPKLLFETSVAPRAYLLRADVLPGVLEPSDTTSRCPYKGDATYWHVRTPEGLAEDAAWSYETPLPEAGKAIGHLSFAGDDVEVELS